MKFVVIFLTLFSNLLWAADFTIDVVNQSKQDLVIELSGAGKAVIRAATDDLYYSKSVNYRDGSGVMSKGCQPRFGGTFCQFESWNPNKGLLVYSNNCTLESGQLSGNYTLKCN
ncbi:MAG: hypothetical protein ACK5MF_08090 [Vibrio sp.]|uniref:hypothetical protein n=1 Tax=Vibrio sp. TaxID=678 RepID=UPI003A8C5B82